ncbi:hypothetical protein BGZ49_006373 [Haplosporangium sp. Z 27]|nr:hypothetical protein BGZ49_006373 [Haplosporangium sp. Z 27]
MYSNTIVRMLIAVILLAPALVVARTAHGFVRSEAGGSKFTSGFAIDNIGYHFTGHLIPAVQDFSSSVAELEYDSLEQLTSLRTFEGKLEGMEIFLRISNGPTISGSLDVPIHPELSVNGSGTWVLSYIWPQDENWSQERLHCRAFLVQ